MKTALAIALAALSFNAHAILACSSADANFDDPDATGPGTVETVTWYVGQPAPDLNVGAEQFVSCAANGAELTYITQRFSGLPMRGNGTRRTILWRGDAAVFILDNL